jgi:hypothetical protein
MYFRGIETDFGTVSAVDLELAIMLHPNDQLRIPYKYKNILAEDIMLGQTDYNSRSIKETYVIRIQDTSFFYIVKKWHLG